MQDAQANIEFLQKKLETESSLQAKANEQGANLTRRLRQQLDITQNELEHERRVSNDLKAENEEKRNLLDKQEQLLQEKTTELDTERRDARENIKALEDDLERVQDNLAQTLQVASSLASRSNAHGRTINRKRIKEETSPGSPSGRQKKRARNGSLHLPEPDPAGNPILLD